MRKALGFTLIEILLVITVIGILSVAALSSYMNSTKTFAFISAYKDIIAILREPRAYAVSSKTVDGQIVQRFGVAICPHVASGTGSSACNGFKNDFTVFADDGKTSFSFDAGSKPDADTQFSTKDIGSLSGDPSKSYVFAKDPDLNEMKNIDFPFYLFYENGTGNLSVYAQQGSSLIPVSQADARYLSFLFSQSATSFLKYILVFQMSGISEGFDVKPKL